ncbi:MAG: glycosyltransferase family 2 protein [Ignavibacteriota bacterium]
MKDQKQISFIVPCRNESKYIVKTINSILSQDMIGSDFEIIIVDGISDDGTREKLKELELQDSRIVIIDNEKKVTPVALNLGVKKAKGDYILILGAHASIAADYAYNCIKILESHVDASCAGGPIISIGESNLGKAIAVAMSSTLGVGNAKHRFPNYEGFAEMACFPVYKKEVFEQIGLFDEQLVRNQDDDFSFRLRLKGGKIFISPKAKSFYVVRDSLPKLFKQYSQYGYWRVALLKKHKLPIAMRQQIPFLFFSSVILLILLGIILQKMVVGIILPVVYFITLIIFSLKIFIFEKKYFAYWLPVVIPVLHFSYAYGFFQGILKFSISKKQKDYKN